MPVKKQMALSRKTSSVVTMTQVTESRSSLTSLKTITHKRSSSGKMMESWSSPTLALTSPQTWVSGLQAKFLSPPKSPSPKRRIITRRSSVYVKPGWSEKFQSKSPPKGLEFKVPCAAIATVSSKRSRQSAVFQKSSRESVSGRRSSVYRKSSKNDTGNVVALNQEEKLDATKGKKGKSVSPKRKITKLSSPSEKKFKSPLKVTRTRKRNVSELEKEESPEKPAAKRRKQADGKVLGASPSREKKSVKKTITFSPQQKEAKRQVKKTSRKTTRKTAQSLSPQRARSTKSEQLTSLEQSSPRKDDESPSPQRAKKASRAKKPAKSPASGKKSAKSPRRPRKTAKSPASPAKGTKSVSPQGTDNFDQRVLTKTGKSPKVPRKVSKTPASSKKVDRTPASSKKVDKTPASSRKSAKSTPKPRKGTRKAAKSLSAKKTRSAKTVLQVSSLSIGDDNDGDDEEEDTAGNNSIISRRQKRKMTTKDDSNQQTPKPKALKLSNTPQHTAKQKSATSAKSKSKKSLTRSGQVKTKKAVSQKSSANEDEVVTSWSSLSFSQFDSVEETPSKKKMQETKHKKTPTPTKKDKEKTNKIKAEENRITSTPELKISSSGKKSSSAKSARGKKAAGSKSPTKKRSISTPKSTIKANVKSRKSSVKKSASVARASSATERLDISDSLDGSYLEISRQQSNKTSLDSSPSKKRKSATAVRSVEDEKILEILKEAVTTPKSRNKVSTPKSTKISTPKPAKSSKKLTPSKISTPKSATSSKKSIPSKISTPKSQKVTKSATASRSTKVYQVSSDSLMTSETSSRKSIGQMSKATQDRRKSSRSLLTPLTHHSGVASVSRIRSDSMLEGLSNEDQQLSSYNRSAQSVLPVAQTSHARTYQEEKSFAQYVEYQGKSGSERYGAQSVERTVGDQVYRAGSFRTERRKGSQEEVEFEEGQWAGGDANNSAVVSEKKEYEDENLNATISTSTYSNRCTIL